MSLGYIRLSTRITLLVMLLVLLGGGIWIKGENRRLETKYWAERGMELDKSLQNEQARLEQVVHTLQQDTLFLSNTPPVSGIVRADANHGFDALDGNTRQKWEQRLQEIFAAFLRAHPKYFRVSYIAAAHQGRTLVSVARQGADITVELASERHPDATRFISRRPGVAFCGGAYFRHYAPVRNGYNGAGYARGSLCRDAGADGGWQILRHDPGRFGHGAGACIERQ